MRDVRVVGACGLCPWTVQSRLDDEIAAAALRAHAERVHPHRGTTAEVDAPLAKAS